MRKVKRDQIIKNKRMWQNSATSVMEESNLLYQSCPIFSENMNNSMHSVEVILRDLVPSLYSQEDNSGKSAT